MIKIDLIQTLSSATGNDGQNSVVFCSWYRPCNIRKNTNKQNAKSSFDYWSFRWCKCIISRPLFFFNIVFFYFDYLRPSLKMKSTSMLTFEETRCFSVPVLHSRLHSSKWIGIYILKTEIYLQSKIGEEGAKGSANVRGDHTLEWDPCPYGLDYDRLSSWLK